MEQSGSTEGQSASELIDKRIAELGDWRGETLSKIRKLIKEADPDVVEEVKWMKPTNPGTPVWSHDGIICTGESYKSKVKFTFAKGASLKDSAKLFNSSLGGRGSASPGVRVQGLGRGVGPVGPDDRARLSVGTQLTEVGRVAQGLEDAAVAGDIREVDFGGGAVLEANANGVAL